jgi:adenine-specific DNA-methyltransferase
MAAIAAPSRTVLKERGAFYTPPSMAEFLVRWAVHSPSELVLDPSCGDGEFLSQAVRRLVQLGAAAGEAASQVIGVDFNPEATAQSVERIRAETCSDAKPQVLAADFFSCRPSTRTYANRLDAEVLPTVDAIVGNPPYIRYHGFQGAVRLSAAAAVAQQEVRLTDLTSSWAPFVVHATSFLKPTGRLAFVLPGELLSVDYAKTIRDFLAVAFRSVTIVAFNERVFPGVLADTVLVLADKQGSEEGLALARLQNLSELPKLPSELLHGTRTPFARSQSKWSYLILGPAARDAYRACDELPGVARLGTRFSVDIGVVSGNNDFFVLTEAQLKDLRLPSDEVIPILSSSRHLRGIKVGTKELEAIRSSGQRCWLLNLAGRMKISQETRAYLLTSRRTGIRTRYKIRSRRRWHDVPSVYAPDAFMSYFISEAPRFVANEVGATSTNTIHRLRRLDKSAPDTLPLILSCYSTLTQLSAEVEGRSYGGGVGKLETKEAESLRVVLPSNSSSRELLLRQAKVHALLQTGELREATGLIDEILLEGQLSLTPARIRELDSGLLSLRSRRVARMQKSAV